MKTIKTHLFKRCVVSITGLCLALLSYAASANTVLTESFEIPDVTNFITYGTGSSFITASNTWDVTSGSVDIYQASARPEAVAFDLEQAIDLAGSPGAAIIETTFSTTPGQTYQLIFYYARNNNLGATDGEALVEIEGTATLLNRSILHSPQQYAFDVNLMFSDFFVADAATATLRFTSLVDGVAGITLDAIAITESNISVVNVPVLPWIGYLALSVFFILAHRLMCGRNKLV